MGPLNNTTASSDKDWLLKGWLLGTTALIQAIRAGNTEAVEYLVTLPTELNTKGAHGWTPLIWAVKSGRADYLRLLIEKGALLNELSYETLTALDYADRSDEMVDMLRTEGALRAYDLPSGLPNNATQNVGSIITQLENNLFDIFKFS